MAASPPIVLVLGSANMDLVARVARIPKPGESLIGTSFITVPGGKGANQAVAAARLGALTHFAGCVGSDAFGGQLRASLTAAGADTTYLRSHLTEPTGTAIILVADDGSNSIVVTPSANFGLRPADVEALAPLFTGLDALLVQLEIPLDSVEAALDLARTHGVLSVLDAGPAQPVPQSLLRKADIVSPNETEAEAMTGIAVHSLDDALNAARRLRELGAREVVMKLGGRGALYVGEETIHMPGFRVRAVDTVAAGDAFTAALALRWKSGAREALRFANAAGALAVTRHGAQSAMPTLAEVESFLCAQPEAVA